MRGSLLHDSTRGEGHGVNLPDIYDRDESFALHWARWSPVPHYIQGREGPLGPPLRSDSQTIYGDPDGSFSPDNENRGGQ